MPIRRKLASVYVLRKPRLTACIFFACSFATLTLFSSVAYSGSEDTLLCSRSVESATSYLEYLQCDAWRILGIRQDIFQSHDIQASLDFLDTLSKKYGRNPCQDSFEAQELIDAGIRLTSWTPYDSPDLLLLLADRERRIRSVLRDDGMLENTNFILGSLPIGELTASVIRVPNKQVSERIIVFDAGLMSLTWLLSKIIGEATLLTMDGNFNRSTPTIRDFEMYANELRRRLAERSNLQQEFSQQLFDYVVHQNPMRSYRCYNLDDRSYQMSRGAKSEP